MEPGHRWDISPRPPVSPAHLGALPCPLQLSPRKTAGNRSSTHQALSSPIPCPAVGDVFFPHSPWPKDCLSIRYIPGLGTLPPGKWSKISGLRSRQMGTAQLQLRMFPSSGSQGGQRHRCAGRAPEPNQRCESCLLGGTGGQGAEAAPAGRS